MMFDPSMRRRLVLALAVTAIVPSARADKNWKTTVSDGSWNVAANWAEGAIPNSSDWVYIYFNDSLNHLITYNGAFSSNLAMNMHNTGLGVTTLSIASSVTLQCGWSAIGGTGHAAINQSNGTFLAQSFLSLGDGTGGNGTYTLSGGTVSIGGSGGVNGLFVGDAGAGTFNQSAGVVTAASVPLVIGNASGATGTYLLSSTGSLNANFGTAYIGANGSGTMIQSGGTFTTATGVILKIAAGTFSQGSYQLQSGTFNAGGDVSIGEHGNGVFTQSGGTVSIGSAANPRSLNIGSLSSSPNYSGGTYAITSSSARLNVSKDVNVADDGLGTFAVDAGAAVIQGNLSVVNDGSGTIIVDGGALTVNAYESVGGYDGAAHLNLSAGSNTANYISIGSAGGSVGTFTQTGGTSSCLTAEYISRGGVYQSGGTHNIATDLTIGNGWNAGDDNGTFSVSGTGVANVGGSVYLGNPLPGHSIIGNLQVSGGSMNVTGGLTIADTGAAAPNGSGARLSGGMLNVGTINTSGNPARFQWTGGAFGVNGINGLSIVAGGQLGPSLSLDATRSLRVANTLAIGTDGSVSLSGGTLSVGQLFTTGNPGVFNFNGGTLAVTGPSGILISSGGPVGSVLSLTAGKNLRVGNTTAVGAGGLMLLRDGTVSSGPINNSGEIQLDSSLSQISGGLLTNSGLVHGDGRINNNLSNSGSGEVRAADGERLEFTGSTNTNLGKINLQNGGDIEFTGSLSNASGGRIIGRGTLFASGGLNNSGLIQMSAGLSDVYGPVTNNSGSKIIITGGSTTTFYDPITHNGGAEINVAANSAAVFLSPITGAGILSGAGAKYFADGSSSLAAVDTSGSSVVESSAMVSTGHVREAALEIDGAVNITPSGAASGVSRLSSLDVLGAGHLDLANNSQIIDYTGANTSTSPAAKIRGYLTSGYNHGAWSGPGIMSSTAQVVAADSLQPHKTALGFAEASAIGTSSFANQNFDNTTLLIRYTYSGDANLDGIVNTLDFNALASNFGKTPGSDVWTQGDFSYDGSVNSSDFDAIAGNFGQVMTLSADVPQGAVSLGAFVPEPSIAIWIAAAAGLIRRRVQVNA